jgi:hypothetical protein
MPEAFPRWSRQRFVQGVGVLLSTMYLPLATAELFLRSLPPSGTLRGQAEPSPAALLWPMLILILGSAAGALTARGRRQAALAAWTEERGVPRPLRSLGPAADLLTGVGCVAGMVLFASGVLATDALRPPLPLVAGPAIMFLAVCGAALLEARIIEACVDSPASRLQLRCARMRLAVVSGAAVALVGAFGFTAPEWLRVAVGLGALGVMGWVVILTDRSMRRQRGV